MRSCQEKVRHELETKGYVMYEATDDEEEEEEEEAVAHQKFQGGGGHQEEEEEEGGRWRWTPRAAEGEAVKTLN